MEYGCVKMVRWIVAFVVLTAITIESALFWAVTFSRLLLACSFMGYPSTLKVETVRSSGTSLPDYMAPYSRG
jgi:hypothetical protein